jgi:hypothetical protein
MMKSSLAMSPGTEGQRILWRMPFWGPIGPVESPVADMNNSADTASQAP